MIAAGQQGWRRPAGATTRSAVEAPLPQRTRWTLALVIALGWLGLDADRGGAQSPAAPTTPSTAQESSASTAGNGQATSWIARDPYTGRLYQQEVVTTSVPVTQWEIKPVTTTVYEPAPLVRTVPSQQTTFVPSTQYVMQPKIRGWWNPLAAPVQTYEFVPVTTWVPQTQTVQQPVTSWQWQAKQQVVYVPQVVSKIQTQQQIVSRELPQPAAGGLPGYSSASQPMMASQLRGLGGLRPIATAMAPAYSAPLRSASTANANGARDAFQTGMAPTVLR